MLDKFSSTPNYGVGKNYLNNAITQSKDLRSPGYLRLAEKEFSYRLKVATLLVLDSFALWLGWSISFSPNSQFFGSEAILSSSRTTSLFCTVLVFMLCLFYAFELYRKGDKSRDIFNSIKAVSLAHVSILPIIYRFYSPRISSQLFVAGLLAATIIVFQRSSLSWIWAYVRQKHTPLRQKILLIGNSEELSRSKTLLESSEVFQVAGELNLSDFEDDESLHLALDRVHFRELDEVFICSWEAIPGVASLYWKLKTIGVNWRILPINIKLPKRKPDIDLILGVPTIRFANSAIVGIDFFSKRIFDVVVSLFLLVIIGVPLLIIAALIKLDSSGSILYKQTRVGLKGNHFKIWKFRTMVENASELQQQLEAQNEVQGGILFKIKDDPRITKVGKYLRRYSLDELPQLFNVLRGEMSLVGPRPLPVRDVAKFADDHFFRQEVLPGITGLWQVSGRSDTGSDGVFNLDFEYIENWSLLLDFKILLQTVQVVFRAKGAY